MGVEPYPTFSNAKAKEITANHPGTGAQYKITITYETEMNADFSDLRFSDGTTALKYWIESTSGSIETEDLAAIVWVKLSAENYIYWHYGKNDATSESNPDDVFTLYDDFTGSNGVAPDSLKWDVVKQGSESATVALDGSGNLQLAGASGVTSSGNVRSKNTIGTNGFIVELRHKITDEHYADTSIGSNTLIDISGGTSDWHHTMLASGYSLVWQTPVSGESIQDLAIRIVDSSSSTVLEALDAGSLSTVDEFHTIGYIYSTSGFLQVTHDNTSLFTGVTDTTYQESEKYLLISQGEYSSGIGGTRYVDWVRVRKYYATEPTLMDYTITPAPVAEFTVTHSLAVTFTDTSTNTPTAWDWDFGDESEHATTQNPTHTYESEGTYTVVLTATNAGGSDEYSYNVTVSESGGTTTVTIVRIYEMDHLVGTTQKHALQMVAADGSGYSNKCNTPEINAYVDGEAHTGNPVSWTISAFDNTASCFWLTVPSTAEGTVGQNLNINVTGTNDSDVTVEGNIHLNIVGNYGGSSGGGGIGHIITDYSFNPTANTITITEEGYTTIQQEQIISIFNSTTGQWYYNSETRRYGAAPSPWTKFYPLESVTDGVITYTAPDLSATAEDKLQIIVNIS